MVRGDGRRTWPPGVRDAAARARAASALVSVAASAVWLALLAAWFTAAPAVSVTEDVPGRDGRPAGGRMAAGAGGRIGEFFQKYPGVAGRDDGAWPRFRGERFDNTSRAPFPVASPFSVTPLWSVPLGEGHAAPAVAAGRVWLLDYDEARKCDALRCFSTDSGAEIWRRFYSAPLKRNHGFSRSIPTLAGGYAVTMGPRGHVMCVKADSGEFVWGVDLEKEYRTETPQWYTAQCPLVDGDEAVIAAAGEAFMIGVELATGRVRWVTPRVPGLALGHSSIVPFAFAGRNMFLYSCPGGLAGVSADRADRGRLLFVHRDWNLSVVAPSPVPLSDGRIFLTAGYGGGSMMVRLRQAGDAIRSETLYQYRPKEGLACEQQTPILRDGLLYGVMPKDAGEYKSQFVCFDPDAKKILWGTGKSLTFGLGPFLLAGDVFLILGETGVLTALSADRAGYRILGQVEVMAGARDAWGPLALTGRVLFLRDSTRLSAIRIDDERGED